MGAVKLEDNEMDFSQDHIKGNNQNFDGFHHELNYAKISSRFIATVIDSIVAQVAAKMIVAALPMPGDQVKVYLYEMLFSMLASFAVIILPLYANGQTLGKKIMKIRLVGEKGQEPTLNQILSREFVGKTISAMIFGIGFIMAIRDGEKRTLHDRMAKTRVISDDFG